MGRSTDVIDRRDKPVVPTAERSLAARQSISLEPSSQGNRRPNAVGNNTAGHSGSPVHTLPVLPAFTS